MEPGAELPVAPCGVDLGFCLTTFQEEPPSPWSEERRCELEETRARRQGARGHNIRLKAVGASGEIFNAHGVDVHRGLGLAGDFGKEGAFLLVAFDEMHAEVRPPGFEDGDDEPGKACP